MSPSATILEGKSENNKKYGGLGKAKNGQHFKQHLAAAFRVFADHGFVEGFTGHISGSYPHRSLWLNPISIHFAHITTSDLVLVNQLGEVVIGERPIPPAAFAIHAEILKARPDINSAAHAHSIYGKTYSAFGKELEMITQDSLRFYKQHAVYKTFGGIVFDRQEGAHIAQALGDTKALILQNHGLLTVGKSPDEAAWWFMSLENLCQVQLLASGSGKDKIIINEEEAVFTNKLTGTPEKGWLAFQSYYDDVLIRSNGSFLK